MGSWTNYWRIVKPEPSTKKYTKVQDNTQQQLGGSVYNNYTWYNQIMTGAGTRLQSYQQFDNMDLDVDVARALDTIAEEMTSTDERTDLPFEIDYQNDDNKEIDESVAMTIKAALRHWADLHELDSRLFGISRDTIKYGDCFFVKTSDHKPWKFVHSKDVLGIELDGDNDIVAYHVKKAGVSSPDSAQDIDSYPADAVLHFTLSDNMGLSAPFGISVLNPVIRSFKQMGLLEDASVIYKVVRAPERRVFYIDVGNMPPQRVKGYLESVKNEMKQKRIPNSSGGQENVDSIYNPMSMTEDYFFGSTTNGRGSRVETLPGGEQSGQSSEVTYFQDKVFRGLRVPTSYLRSSTESPSATFNDGKTGVAYIEELRFANYVRRLQNKLEKVFDAQFKQYLASSGIKIDDNVFKIKLPDPQNFALYRQSLLNSELIATFTSADGIDYMSKRFILKKYLGFTEDDIQTNEALLRQERNIPVTDEFAEVDDIRYFYDPGYFENRTVELPDPNAPAADEADVPSSVDDELGNIEKPDMGQDVGGGDDIDIDAAVGGDDAPAPEPEPVAEPSDEV